LPLHSGLNFVALNKDFITHSAQRYKMKKLTKTEAGQVLSAWTALEVLSPQAFVKPEDLAGGQSHLYASLDEDQLPWQNLQKNNFPNAKLYYQIILGSIDLQKATSALIQTYQDAAQELPIVSGKAILGLIIVDERGCLIRDDTALTASSFAWGLPQALDGQLKKLYNWPSVSQKTSDAFDAEFKKKDADGGYAPVTRELLSEALAFLVDRFAIPKEMVIEETFAIRSYESLKRETSPSPLLLNSFYMDDLAEARDYIESGDAPHNLLQYLGMKPPAERHHVLENKAMLEEMVAPSRISPARWPAFGENPLFFLQQAAVNLTLSELKEEGILAINGPPGTGKTTLLRDIVASLVCEKAKAMAKFDDPSKAFKYTDHRIKAGNAWLYLYELDESLKGFEILIASSNNKAVENISAELPSVTAISEKAKEVNYFSALSDGLLGCETWGLISAVLGNASNRNKFRQKFWWDGDVGFASYLAQACGVPQIYEVRDQYSGQIVESRTPQIVAENDPPENQHEALERWERARTRFEAVLKKCTDSLAELEKMRLLVKEGKGAKTQLTKLRQTLGTHFVDEALFSKSHQEMNLVSPWCNTEMQALRDDVFFESIRLTKAFIDAAAKPLRHNLGILMQHFGKQVIAPDSQVLERMPDLWSTFFLVVPSISTTFASASRMLTHLPVSSLGWLLVDEAGQALPQAAVGAMMKTKRALVTGDPLQIEPVVTLPQSLTEKICAQFKVHVDRFNAPKASVQTLSDDASSYFSEFHGRYGTRTVGFPLLVHRRCAEPMFSIANTIAYEGLMVQQKVPERSPIRDCLGSSVWFHTETLLEPKDKWSSDEGDRVLSLLQRLRDTGVSPDLYILTPFNIVAKNLRRIVRASGILEGWIEMESYRWISERIGTVHTAQGREAEAVILVLGAPFFKQKGARKWAGMTPNLLNVAITRAQEVFYVIGNKDLWRKAGVFQELHDRIPHDLSGVQRNEAGRLEAARMIMERRSSGKRAIV
jgi:hypothetical protein